MTNKEHPELSVVLPAYNEGPAMRPAIDAYRAALAECCPAYEIIVIDDGSADNTPALAEAAAAEDPRVRVLRNERNLGQAASMLRGFAAARGQIITHNGIDLPFDPWATAEMLQRIRAGADVVVVERANREAYGWTRKVLSWCNVLLVRALFGSPFRDHNFVQAFRRRVIESIDVQSRGVSTATTELILKARRAGFAVQRMESPYLARRVGRSSINLRKIVHTVWELLQLYRIMGSPAAVS